MIMVVDAESVQIEIMIEEIVMTGITTAVHDPDLHVSYQNHRVKFQNIYTTVPVCFFKKLYSS